MPRNTNVNRHRTVEGTRVRVKPGHGLLSGHEGRLTRDLRVLNRNERGIPQVNGGHYKPHDHQAEAVVVRDDSTVFTMFWGSLEKVLPTKSTGGARA